MDETSSFLLRMPKPLREEFKRITRKIGANETSTLCILIAEFVSKMNKLEEEGHLPVFDQSFPEKPKMVTKKSLKKKREEN